MSALIVILIIVALIALILCIPAKVELIIKYADNELEFDYVINYAFLKIKKGKSGRLVKYLKEHPDLVKHCLYTLFKYRLNRIGRFNKFELTGVVGLDDAMDTALVYGSAAGFIYNLVGLIERNIDTDNLVIDLKPDFNEPKIFIDFKSIIITKIYKILGWAWYSYRKAIPILKARGEKNNGKPD